MNILVLDNDARTRESVRELLHPDGHVVFGPPRCQRDVSALAEWGVDLTLVDALTDSRDLLELFLAGGPAIAGSDIIVLNPAAEPEGRADSGWLDALGTRAVLRKPVRLGELLPVVAAIASRRQRPEATSSHSRTPHPSE